MSGFLTIYLFANTPLILLSSFLGKKVKCFEIKKCTNQAWDLTYLSFWSTLHYYEENSNRIILFATLDKELKELFTLTHEESVEVYKTTFGKSLGNDIIRTIEKIYVQRDKPDISSYKLDEMIQKEEEVLKQVLK